MDESLLPESARNLVALLGVCDAVTVITALGGAQWYIAGLDDPRSAASRKELIALVGERVEDKLRLHYGGGWLSVPRCHAAMLGLRNQTITDRFVEGCRAGHTVRSLLAQLAREHKLTTKQIWHIVNQAGVPTVPIDTNQLSLF